MVHYGNKSVAEVVTERRIVIQEKYTGRGASSRRFVQKIGGMSFFIVGGASQVGLGQLLSYPKLENKKNRFVPSY